MSIEGRGWAPVPLDFKTGDAERDRQRSRHLPFKRAVGHAYNIRCDRSDPLPQAPRVDQGEGEDSGAAGVLLFANHFFQETALLDQPSLPSWSHERGDVGGGGEVELVVRWLIAQGGAGDGLLILSDAESGHVLGRAQLPTQPLSIEGLLRTSLPPPGNHTLLLQLLSSSDEVLASRSIQVLVRPDHPLYLRCVCVCVVCVWCVCVCVCVRVCNIYIYDIYVIYTYNIHVYLYNVYIYNINVYLYILYTINVYLYIYIIYIYIVYYARARTHTHTHRSSTSGCWRKRHTHVTRTNRVGLDCPFDPRTYSMWPRQPTLCEYMSLECRQANHFFGVPGYTVHTHTHFFRVSNTLATH